MKKIMLLLFLLLFPLSVQAETSTKGYEIIGKDTVSVGETFSLDFKVASKDLINGYDKNTGIWVVAFELGYDFETLVISEIYSPGFRSTVFKENNRYYVVSEVVQSSEYNADCVSGSLYCGDYSATVKFYVKNTNLTTLDITMNNVEVGLLNMDGTKEDYTFEDDAIILASEVLVFHTININRPVNNLPEYIGPTISIPEKKETVPPKSSTPKAVTPPVIKSSNTFLKSLSIENEKIDFDKSKTEYTIYIEPEVNQLNITPQTEDAKSSFTITGADDLKAHDNKATITVTAEDGKQATYIINTLVLEEVVKNDDNNDFSFKTFFKDYKKQIIIGGSILGGSIILTIIILAIIRKIKDGKVDRLFDQL